MSLSVQPGAESRSGRATRRIGCASHRRRRNVMSRAKILVTGATGRTGAAVVSELLKAGYPVRAMVRREDARAGALRAKGVDIAVAEITDMERVSAAMRGVQRAYWLPPYDPDTAFATWHDSPARRGDYSGSRVTWEPR